MNEVSFLILDGPRDPKRGQDPRYRGTFRIGPTYSEMVPAEHEFNRLFQWYLDEGGELGVVHDLSKAIRLVRLSETYMPGRRCEVVEVTEGNALPKVGSIFLGFDLALGYNNSLLSAGLVAEFRGEKNAPVDILWRVVSRYFSPLLNEYRLFSDYDNAAFCLSAMVALQGLQPNMFEGGDLGRFVVVGLYLVE